MRTKLEWKPVTRLYKTLTLDEIVLLRSKGFEVKETNFKMWNVTSQEQV